MDELRTEILREARGWIGTPYVHQASRKGAGTDCLGLLRGLWRTAYGAEPELVPAYTADWSESGAEERLLAAARTHLCAKDLEDMGPADVLIFRMRPKSIAKHIGIVSARAPRSVRFIHAYSGHGVVENTLTPSWRNRISGCFAFPKRTPIGGQE